MWMVRAGRGGENVEAFLKYGIVALGDPKLGAIPPAIKKDDLRHLYAERYPELKEASRESWTSQLLRFIGEVQIDDTVVTFDRDRRLYFLGKVISEYEWAPQLIEENPHVRRAHWTHQIPRDLLTVASRNTLGAILTLFKLGTDVAKDLQEHRIPIGEVVTDLPPKPKELVAEEEEAEEQVRAEVIEKADEFVEDAINDLDWKQLQDLVAGILRSMGYRTTVSPPGADRGVDIFASPDGLGLQEPRIFVEVKHRNQTMGAEKVRAFLGGRRPGDKCLYVSTGSFTREARYEAERASVPTTLLDLQDLRKLLVENYEKLDAETRALVPLKRLYWPLK